MGRAGAGGGDSPGTPLSGEGWSQGIAKPRGGALYWGAVRSDWGCCDGLGMLDWGHWDGLGMLD